MENIKKIRQEREASVVRAFYELGIPLQKVEIFMLAKAAADIFESALIEISTGIPRKKEDFNTISCYNSSVDGRHPINGIWHKITQFHTSKGVLYYTDGKEEKVNV
jgi:hypothetical protein